MWVSLLALQPWEITPLAPVILGVLGYEMQMTIPPQAAVRPCQLMDVKALSTVTYLYKCNKC